MSKKHRADKKIKSERADYINCTPEKACGGINQSIYNAMCDGEISPILYYTAHDPAVGKNGDHYTEGDSTVAHKKHDRQSRPYG